MKILTWFLCAFLFSSSLGHPYPCARPSLEIIFGDRLDLADHLDFKKTTTEADRQFVRKMGELFSLAQDMRGRFTLEDIQNHFSFSRGETQRFVQRSMARGWVREEKGNLIFNEGFEEAFRKGHSLPLRPPFPESFLASFKRLNEAHRFFGYRSFSLKDYLQQGRGNTVTIMHDLNLGVDAGLIKRTIETDRTIKTPVHSFVREVPFEIKKALEENIVRADDSIKTPFSNQQFVRQMIRVFSHPDFREWFHLRDIQEHFNVSRQTTKVLVARAIARGWLRVEGKEYLFNKGAGEAIREGRTLPIPRGFPLPQLLLNAFERLDKAHQFFGDRTFSEKDYTSLPSSMSQGISKLDLDLGGDTGWVEKSVGLYSFREGRGIPPAITEVMDEALNDQRWLQSMGDIFSRFENGFGLQEISTHLSISLQVSKHLTDRAMARGWIRKGGKKFIFNEGASEAIREGRSLPVVSPFPDRFVKSFVRLREAQEFFGGRNFSRRDYQTRFNNATRRTARQDLELGTDVGWIAVADDIYSFVEGAGMPPAIKEAIDGEPNENIQHMGEIFSHFEYRRGFRVSEISVHFNLSLTAARDIVDRGIVRGWVRGEGGEFVFNEGAGPAIEEGHSLPMDFRLPYGVENSFKRLSDAHEFFGNRAFSQKDYQTHLDSNVFSTARKDLLLGLDAGWIEKEVLRQNSYSFVGGMPPAIKKAMGAETITAVRDQQFIRQVGEVFSHFGYHGRFYLQDIPKHLDISLSTAKGIVYRAVVRGWLRREEEKFVFNNGFTEVLNEGHSLPLPVDASFPGGVLGILRKLGKAQELFGNHPFTWEEYQSYLTMDKRGLKVGIDAGLIRRSVLNGKVVYTFIRGANIPLAIKKAMEGNVTTANDQQFIQRIRDLFSHFGSRGFNVQDISEHFSISRHTARHLTDRITVRGWVRVERGEFVFNEGFEEAFGEGRSLAVSAPLSDSIRTAFRRLVKIHKDLENRFFSIREYLSHPGGGGDETARQTMNLGLDVGWIRRSVVDAEVAYRFVEEAPIAPVIKNVMDGVIIVDGLKEGTTPADELFNKNMGEAFSHFGSEFHLQDVAVHFNMSLRSAQHFVNRGLMRGWLREIAKDRFVFNEGAERAYRDGRSLPVRNPVDEALLSATRRLVEIREAFGGRPFTVKECMIRLDGRIHVTGRTLDLGVDMGWIERGVVDSEAVHTFIEGAEIPPMIKKSMDSGIVTQADTQFIRNMGEVFSHFGSRGEFGIQEIPMHTNISRATAKDVVNRAIVRGWLKRERKNIVFNEGFEEAFREGRSLPLNAPLPDGLVNTFKRLAVAQKHFGNLFFSRKEYVALPESGSKAVATRDLDLGVDGGWVERSVVNTRFLYSFVQDAGIPGQ